MKTATIFHSTNSYAPIFERDRDNKTPTMAYMYNPVSTESHHSINPPKAEHFTIVCHSHRVRTIVTSTPSVVRNWLYMIRRRNYYRLRRRRLVVGLGLQWAPGPDPHPATLQLCVGRHCLIFQLLYAAHSPAALHRFLSDPGVTLVGIWNYRDAPMLRNSKHRLHVPGLVDVRHVASDLRGCSRRMSMESLASVVLGMDGLRKKKRVGRSAWDEKWLSDEQVEYACLDAFLCFLMGKALRVWNWNGC